MAKTDAEFLAWLKASSATRTILVVPVARISSTETTLYLSNRPYTDGVANIAYTSCVTGGVSFSENLNLSGAPSISYGDIEIDNSSGVRDQWLDYIWDNRAVTVYMGDSTWVKADFRIIFSGVIGSLSPKSTNSLSLRLLDKLQRLNVPIQEATLSNGTDQKDRVIPLLLGECHNIEPLLENPTTLVYRYNYEAANGIAEVRDSGAPIVTYTASDSTGKFTLTAAPVGQITLTAQGVKPSGTYSSNVANLIKYVVTTYGPSTTRFTTDDLDLTSLTAFASSNTQPVGYYIANRENMLTVCQSLAASVGAQVVMTTLGKLRLVKLDLPPSGTPVAVTPSDMELRSLTIAERPSVAATCKLGYCKNWTLQTSGLATGLPARSASSFATEFLTTISTDSTVATNYKLDAQPVQEDTCLLIESDAVTEAARRKTLWATQRHIYTAKYFSHMMLTELGDPVTITHPRFGLSAGKTGLVVSIARDWFAGRVSIGVLI